ncbi:McrC family protein [Bacteroidota bacterium]
MMNLFEYQNKEVLSDSFDGLEGFLDDVWKNREKSSFYMDSEEKRVESQRFLDFLHKSGQVKSTKYVGVIHFNGQKINLLPKIFFDGKTEYGETEVCQMQNHILWWLSYCRKIKFPNYQASMGSMKSDFFEVLIYLFAKYTRELLNNSIYQQYEEVDRELSFIKGRLNTNEYIRENLSTGRWHKLNCTYDAFVMDNQFNRIIKFVTNQLFGVTGNAETKKHLREILFILDEVSDVPATASQCASIQFNPMFKDFETVRDYCYLFLSNSVSFNYKNELKLFAFLLPMEYVFEDFIFGFIDKELEEVRAKAQRSDTHLDEGKAFNLKPDLHLIVGSKSVIADTKYKIVYSDEKDPKKGISQNDLYQMLAYAVRFKVEEIILFYPNTVNDQQENSSELWIKDELAGGKSIRIRAFQLPVLNMGILKSGFNSTNDLKTLFEPTKLVLKEKLERILESRVALAQSTLLEGED